AEGGVVGCLGITFEWSDWRNGLFWWIQSVFVDKDYRGQGAFRHLYDHVSRLAKAESNVCGIRLYVEDDNTGAQQTYAALGMKETSYKLLEVEF
ncbi:MAG: ribosomal protein S18 acetylase RimI-like enzyme, partial [Candidatus Azotimanducaceae bacterium]